MSVYRKLNSSGSTNSLVSEIVVIRQLDRSIEIRNKICNLATDPDYWAEDDRCGQGLPSDVTGAMPLWRQHSYVLAFRHFAKRHRLHLRWGLSDSAVGS